MFRVSVTVSAALVKVTRTIVFKNKSLPWKWEWLSHLFLEFELRLPQCHVVNFVCSHASQEYIPLISRVRGPYGKLWTEFFPSFYGPNVKRAGHENKEGKNEDPKLAIRTE